MKRSSTVTLTLVAAAALAASTGCRKKEVRDCVGADQRIVDEQLCQQGAPRGFVGVWPYHFMYGGSAGGHVGDTVVGGSTTPSPGHVSVSRGGFGSSMSVGS